MSWAVYKREYETKKYLVEEQEFGTDFCTKYKLEDLRKSKLVNVL